MINKLNKSFKDYEFSNSLLVIEENLNESIKFLKYILYIISFFLIITSIILCLIISLVNSIEQKREIGLLRVFGFSEFEVLKIFFFENLLNSLISLIFALISLIFVDLMLKNVFTSELGIGGISIFSFESILTMIVILVIISLTGTLSTLSTIKKTNIIDCVH